VCEVEEEAACAYQEIDASKNRYRDWALVAVHGSNSGMARWVPNLWRVEVSSTRLGQDADASDEIAGVAVPAVSGAVDGPGEHSAFVFARFLLQFEMQGEATQVGSSLSADRVQPGLRKGIYHCGIVPTTREKTLAEMWVCRGLVDHVHNRLTHESVRNEGHYGGVRYEKSV
jgi:hypothetical protein